VVGNIEGIAFIYFDERDVVRHNLVQQIIKAYDERNTTSPNPSAKNGPAAAAQPARNTVTRSGGTLRRD
jgi:phosphate starvation-inducible protein PhoH and related proteins